MHKVWDQVNVFVQLQNCCVLIGLYGTQAAFSENMQTSYLL